MYLHHNNFSVLPYDFQHVSNWNEFDSSLWFDFDVLKIMCKNLNFILMEIQDVKAVENYLTGDEK